MKSKLSKNLAFILFSILLLSCSTGNNTSIISSNLSTSDNSENSENTSDVLSTSNQNTSETTTASTIDSLTQSVTSTSSVEISSSSSSVTSSEAKPIIDQNILSKGTYAESAYATWNDSNALGCKVEYKLSTSSEFILLDQELIRNINETTVRFDAVGLKAGVYDFKITTSSNQTLEMKNITVTAYDRSGYAFYNTSEGIGAYNQDGTLMANADVIYVNDENKNTVALNGKVGIVEIINSAKGERPLCVRFLGKVISDTKGSDGKYQGLYTRINGLKDEYTGSNNGTYYNMMDVDYCKNITLEGIGDDAEIFQWGMEFNECSSIEVRNLTYTHYTDDACGVFGNLTDPSKCQRYYIHNNRFNVGQNLADDTGEKDKLQGDGATDVKGVSYCTYAYNSYYSCKKTFLVGGSDSDLTSHISFHHNYYSNCYSRLPLGRQANMHFYNNYFENAKNTSMDLRANAYVFAEGNYFYKCKNPVKTKGGAAYKSFNDVFDSCSSTNNATIASSREQAVSSTCKYGQNFDTDASNFYYDATKKVSNVAYLTDANQAKIDAVTYSGPAKINPTYETVSLPPVQTSSSSSSFTSTSSITSSQQSSSSSSIISFIPTGENDMLNASDIINDDYTSSISIGNFMITATSGKSVSVIDSGEYLNFNPAFIKAIKLGGKGTRDYRSINFTLAKQALVKVYARSTSTSTRVLQLNNYDSQTLITSNDVNGVAKEITYTLDAGKYYIQSSNSNIEVAAIIINY